MKATSWIFFGLLLSTTVGASGDSQKPEVAKGGSAEDEKAIRGMIDAFVQSFARGDAKAIAALYTEQGEAIDAEGAAIRGRSSLETHYAERFTASPGEKLEATVELIDFLGPEIVRQDGSTKLVPVGSEPPSSSRYTATLVKSEGRWLIASIRELDDTAISHHERLRELEWLVGDWVEESGGVVVTTAVAWSEDKNYLLRSYETRVHGKTDQKGTQRIGWDPLTKQVKSWLFDSQGSHSEGYWSRNGDQWVVKSSGVRHDGLPTSATQFITRVHKDRLAWKSTNRTLGGETQGDIQEFTMVRIPPEPR